MVVSDIIKEITYVQSIIYKYVADESVVYNKNLKYLSTIISYTQFFVFFIIVGVSYVFLFISLYVLFKMAILWVYKSKDML